MFTFLCTCEYRKALMRIFVDFISSSKHILYRKKVIMTRNLESAKNLKSISIYSKFARRWNGTGFVGWSRSASWETRLQDEELRRVAGFQTFPRWTDIQIFRQRQHGRRFNVLNETVLSVCVLSISLCSGTLLLVVRRRYPGKCTGRWQRQARVADERTRRRSSENVARQKQHRRPGSTANPSRISSKHHSTCVVRSELGAG